MWVDWENTQAQILKPLLLTAHCIHTMEKQSSHKLSILDGNWLYRTPIR